MSRRYFGKSRSRGLTITASGFRSLIAYHNFRCRKCTPKIYCGDRANLNKNLDDAVARESNRLGVAR